jgi:hypothetical protein
VRASVDPPHPDLRSRVLAAAMASPVAPRTEGVRRRAVALAAGFAVPLAISLALGFPRAGGRPAAYVATLAASWLGVGLAATWAGVSRGRSMLGRRAAWRLLVAALTPAALFATALAAALAWPSTRDDEAGALAHVVCVAVGMICALGPLAAFAAVRRSSDPVAPRLTGAALGAASGAWGALFIELHCVHTSVGHIVLGHVLPVVLLTLVGVLIGDRVVAIRPVRAAG